MKNSSLKRIITWMIIGCLVFAILAVLCEIARKDVKKSQEYKEIMGEYREHEGDFLWNRKWYWMWEDGGFNTNPYAPYFYSSDMAYYEVEMNQAQREMDKCMEKLKPYTDKMDKYQIYVVICSVVSGCLLMCSMLLPIIVKNKNSKKAILQENVDNTETIVNCEVSND